MTPLAACLLAVFVAAKIIAVVGHTVPDSFLSPFVYLWQDVAIVLAFLAIARMSSRAQWLTRTVYAALVVLVAINVPVIRVLSSAVTMPMLRAARGPLADSFAHYATFANIAGVAFILALGAALPFVRADQWPRWLRAPRAWLAVGGCVMIVGVVGASRVDWRGIERNPVVALARTMLPRMRAEMTEADWRVSPFDAGHAAGDVLARSDLRGAAAGRNVLLVVLESTGARYLAPYGAREDPMPNVTALATESLVFDNAYAVYPESIKGLVSILASRYPGFDVPAERHAMAMSSSLASVLDSAGYATALFHSGRFMYLGMEEVIARSGFGVMEDAGAIGGNRNSSFGIDERATVGRMLHWIDSLPRGARFFATYLPIAGHHPYASASGGPFSEDTDLGRYRNALHEGDAALGTLLQGLRARGLDRSTLIVILGDHGEAFGQHEGNYGHTLALYEENLHVPFVVAIPGVASAAGHVKKITSLLDVAPTILDLIGAPSPATFQGASLLDARERLALFFTDYSLGLLGVRDGCIKYTHELESGRASAFDICRDPEERNDISAAVRARVPVYRERLLAWSAAQVGKLQRE